MAFAPVSSLTVEGLNKFLSMNYHNPIQNVIYTFAELGIADRLIHAAVDRGMTVEEIIGNDREQWNSQLLFRVIRACVSAGIVKQVNDDKHFVLTSSGMMMTSDHPSHVRDYILFCFGSLITSAFEHLSKMVCGEGRGSGVARVTGGIEFYDLLMQPDQKEFQSIFGGAMIALSLQNGDNLVNGIDFSRFKTIVDVGGNRGTFLAQILQAYPTIEHGIVFDLPPVVDQHEVGEEFTSREIPNDRWSFVAGDMFDASTIPLGDAYVLKHILHNHEDEKCVSILSSIRDAIKDRKQTPTTIFIVGRIILADGAVSQWQTHAIDALMAVMFTNARERSLSEYTELLEKSNWTFKTFYPLETPHSIIEATLI